MQGYHFFGALFTQALCLCQITNFKWSLLLQVYCLEPHKYTENLLEY